MDKIKTRIFILNLLLIAITAVSIHIASWWLIKTHQQSALSTQIALANDYISQHFNSREHTIVLAAELITKDYGFRQAVATGDKPTIQSMLENHSARIDADYFVISDNAGQTLAAQQISDSHNDPHFELDSVDHLKHSEGTAFITVKDHLFRVVVIPVFAPREIGHAIIGYQITPKTLEMLKQKTEIDLHFYSHAEDKLLISTNRDSWHHDQQQNPTSPPRGVTDTDAFKQADFGKSLTAKNIRLYLQADTSVFDQSQHQLHFQILFITLLAILLASLLSSSLAKKLADPLSALYRDLSHRANYDYLTGITNRHAALAEINTAIQRLSRTGQPYCVGLCDIDNFKQINDQYGHSVGDHVLKQFSQRLYAALRASDTLGRFGGEEFLIGMEVSAEAAVEAFDRLRQIIAEMPITNQGTVIHITMSCGVCIVDNPAAVISTENIVEKADTALYKAKRNGKNRITISRL